MTGYEIAVLAAKLAFGTAAFLLIGYLGSSGNRRIAGTMLTFPVLNGIGLIASPGNDPDLLTASMMPVIVLNAFLCFGTIVAFRAIRLGRPQTDIRALAYGLGAAGATLWFAAAGLLMPPLEPTLPSSGWIAAIYLAATVALTPLLWSGPQAPPAAGPVAQSGFAAFWRPRRARIAFFLVSLLAMLMAAEFGSTAWVGRLSALPLVPLCVLAGLAIDDPDGLRARRDPVLIGPGLAMLFVLPFTAILSALQGAAPLAYWGWGLVSLLAGWIASILAIRHGIPPLARALDRWKRPAANLNRSLG